MVSNIQNDKNLEIKYPITKLLNSNHLSRYYRFHLSWSCRNLEYDKILIDIFGRTLPNTSTLRLEHFLEWSYKYNSHISRNSSYFKSPSNSLPCWRWTLLLIRSIRSQPESDRLVLDFSSRLYFPGQGNRLPYLEQLLNRTNYPKSELKKLQEHVRDQVEGRKLVRSQ